MRQIRHDKAILDGAGFALIRVADDVLDGIGLLAHQVPFHAGGETGASHAAQFSSFELGENDVPGARRCQLTQNAVLFAIAVRISFACGASLLRVRLAELFAAKGAPRNSLSFHAGNVRENLVVYRDRRSVIAAPEAGDI